MSSFFLFFFVFFSLVSFSREKIVVPLLLLFLLLFFLFFFLSLFSVEKIYIAPLSKEVFVRTQPRPHTQRERRIFAPLTLERYRRKGNSHRYYFFLLSFSLLFVSRRGTNVLSVCDMKKGMEYFRDDHPKERKKRRKVVKKRAETAPKKHIKKKDDEAPKKGRRKIQNICLHTKLFITYTRCCAYHQPAADQTYRCLGAITSFFLLFLLR